MSERYRVVVNIIRGTAAGRALNMMANGQQCVADTLEKSAVIFDAYLDAAAAVLKGVDQRVCFGHIAVLDTQEGLLVRNHVFMGGKG